MHTTSVGMASDDPPQAISHYDPIRIDNAMIGCQNVVKLYYKSAVEYLYG
jgi:hypothetical protein